MYISYLYSVMWREQGKGTYRFTFLSNEMYQLFFKGICIGLGELYLYANREAQDPAICQMPNNYCAPKYGWSLNTGAFTFKTGEWTDIQEIIRLNTPGQRNGLLSISVNGREVIRYENIVFRIASYPNMRLEGMDVDTFFGGTGTEWATPTHQITKFKEFILETA